MSGGVDGVGESDETAEQVLERLRGDSSFVLAAHENPDGDALGSLIAMQGLLAALGKEAEMFLSPSDLPLGAEYDSFDLRNVIQAPPADIAQRTVVFLDCGNIDRNSAAVLRDGAHLINIDHHHDNTRFGTINHVVPAASCTAEVVWELMHGLEVTPTGQVARALYIGLVTDTGRFMYENTGPKAHQMAAELISAGVDVQETYRQFYEEVPIARLMLLGRAVAAIRRYDGGELTFSSLTVEDFCQAEAEAGDYEGIVDHLRAVKDTKVAALVREVAAPEGQAGSADHARPTGASTRTEPIRRKVSLRATGDEVDVSAIARTQGGGGHRRAAGFTTELELEQIVAELRREIASQLAAEQSAAPVA